MFDPAYGTQWQRIRDAFEAGDTELPQRRLGLPHQIPANVQHTVMRTTTSGSVYGEPGRQPDQALRAITINGAHQLKL